MHKISDLFVFAISGLIAACLAFLVHIYLINSIKGSTDAQAPIALSFEPYLVVVVFGITWLALMIALLVLKHCKK
jgi:hypothetical protein